MPPAVPRPRCRLVGRWMPREPFAVARTAGVVPTPLRAAESFHVTVMQWKPVQQPTA